MNSIAVTSLFPNKRLKFKSYSEIKFQSPNREMKRRSVWERGLPCENRGWEPSCPRCPVTSGWCNHVRPRSAPCFRSTPIYGSDSMMKLNSALCWIFGFGAKVLTVEVRERSCRGNEGGKRTVSVGRPGLSKLHIK